MAPVQQTKFYAIQRISPETPLCGATSPEDPFVVVNEESSTTYLHNGDGFSFHMQGMSSEIILTVTDKLNRCFGEFNSLIELSRSLNVVFETAIIDGTLYIAAEHDVHFTNLPNSPDFVATLGLYEVSLLNIGE